MTTLGAAIGWVLNLDADLELADPSGHAPSARLARQAAEQGAALLASANAHAPKAVQHQPLSAGGAATAVQAWCPTPCAQQAAKAAGAEMPAAPSLDVLQRCNHRAFAAAIGPLLPGAAFVESMVELDTMLAVEPALRLGWLLKRPFGFSGRGQKRVPGPLGPGDRRWAEASMWSCGRGLMVEPFVPIEHEYAMHSWLDRDGDCLTGQPTCLRTDADGAWLGSALLDDAPGDAQLLDGERDLLEGAHRTAAQALTAAGYFGPFGTDAFAFRDEEGRRRLQPLSELNARYTMAYFVGIGTRQTEWLAKVRASAR